MSSAPTIGEASFDLVADDGPLRRTIAGVQGLIEAIVAEVRVGADTTEVQAATQTAAATVESIDPDLTVGADVVGAETAAQAAAGTIDDLRPALDVTAETTAAVSAAAGAQAQVTAIGSSLAGPVGAPVGAASYSAARSGSTTSPVTIDASIYVAGNADQVTLDKIKALQTSNTRNLASSIVRNVAAGVR